MEYLSQFFENAKKVVAGKVAHASHQEIHDWQPEEWIDTLINPIMLPFIEEDGDPTWDHETVREYAQDYGRHVEAEVVYSVIEWPLKPHERLGLSLQFKPSSHDLSLPVPEFNGKKLKFRIRIAPIAQLKEEFIISKAQADIHRAIEGYRREFQNRNKDIEQGFQVLREHTKEIVFRRKSEVDQKVKGLEELKKVINIPLKKKVEEIRPIIIERKKDLSVRHSSSGQEDQPTKEYVLDRRKFEIFVGYIERYIRSCERTAIPFKDLQEEAIRDLILPYLNQVFEAGATGETFSKKGKTDVYLVIEQGCILICECKWWRGPKSMEEVIGQVLDRVTWRENYGIVLIFVKGSISEVIEKAKDTIRSHSTNVGNEVIQISSGHLCSKNKRNDDQGKYLEIRYLFCNFSE